jgi:isoleucyl-tRNA synthetase
VGYAILDGIDPARLDPTVERSVMDRWLQSRLQVLVRDTRRALEAYDLPPAVKAVEGFIEDLSNWYVRLNRRRFWKSGSDSDKAAAYLTLHETLTTLCRLLAPILPFLSEEIYQNLVRSVDARAPESVHLCPYPEVREDRIDEGLMAEMETAIRLVSLGRAARTSFGLKVRQPLAEMVVVTGDGDAAGLDRMRPLILQELNVKGLRLATDRAALVQHSVKLQFGTVGRKFGKLVPGLKKALEGMDPESVASRAGRGEAVEVTVDGQPLHLTPEDLQVEARAAEGLAVAEDAGIVVALDTRITEELEDEGFAREFVHRIQTMRKEAGLEIADRIRLACEVGERLRRALGRFEDYILSETLCLSLSFEGPVPDGESCRINGEEAVISLRRAS